METNEKTIGRIYNCNEAAQELGISVQTLARIRKRKEIKLLGITGRYFSLEQLQQIKNFLTHTW